VNKHTTFYYLLKVQYLGFRYHGWQVQPQVKTVQKMIERTLSFVFEHSDFKILGASRTDAMVSAEESAFELFVKKPLDTVDLMASLNKSLPNDIRISAVSEVDAAFNILQDSKRKEYLYLFSEGQKNHPFCAPFLVGIPCALNIPLMQEGAKLFEGIHHFQRYAYKPSEQTNFEREILLSEIVSNDLYTANFFPEKSYLFRVVGKGFLRYQIRLMMGVLFQVGKGEVDLDFVKDSLENPNKDTLKELAPASGLQLHKLHF
jgi:tRNA pseudouridine38-40 synthase